VWMTLPDGDTKKEVFFLVSLLSEDGFLKGCCGHCWFISGYNNGQQSTINIM